jgi:hypothetical protein
MLFANLRHPLLWSCETVFLGPGGVGPSIPANLNAMINTLGSRSNFLSFRCYTLNCQNRFSEPTTGSNGLINCPVRTDVSLVLD